MIMQPILLLGDRNLATCTTCTGALGVVLAVGLVVGGATVVVVDAELTSDGVEDAGDVVTVTVLVPDEPQPSTALATSAAATGVRRLTMGPA
jgi:hypothetical protein